MQIGAIADYGSVVVEPGVDDEVGTGGVDAVEKRMKDKGEEEGCKGVSLLSAGRTFDAMVAEK